MAFPRRRQYFRTNTIDISHDIVVPEPQHGESALAEMAVAPGIRGRFRVLGAIDLDYELWTEADEIEDVAVERVLPAEAQPFELIPP
jgi:hypothetical protein